MLTGILGLLGRSRAAKPTPVVATKSAPEEEEIPRYPPDQKGLPVVSVARLLETQQGLIKDIRQTLGLEYSEFDRLIRPVLERYAAFVHLLPASEKNHHCGAGGLLRHGLEVAFYAARASEGEVFVAAGTPLERKALEPRWHVAVCLAGLLHDLGKPVSDLSVVDRDGTTKWKPYKETIIEWATAHKLDRYFLHWRPQRHKRHESMGLAAAVNVLTPEIQDFLGEPDPEIIACMNDAIISTEREDRVASLVKHADTYSTSKDLRESRHDPDAGLGVPIVRYLLSAMRRLVASGDWKLNERGARVWVTSDAVFVVWKQAAEDIIRLLSQDEIKGLPKDARQLAEILVERDYAIPYVGPDKLRTPYWPVAPDLLRSVDGAPVVLHMVRLSGTHLLFDTEAPSVTSARVGGEALRTESSGAAAPAVSSGRSAAPHPAGAAGKEGAEAAPATPPGSAPSLEATRANTPAQKPRKASDTTVKETDDERTIHIGSPVNNKPATATAAAPSAPRPRPEEFLAARGEAGKTLLAMAQDIARQQSSWGQSLARVGERLLVRYPDGVRPYGESEVVLKALSDVAWIELDPTAPNRKVRELGGERGLVLVTEIAAHVLSVALEGEGAPTANETRKVASPPPADAGASASSQPTPGRKPEEPKAGSPAAETKLSENPEIEELLRLVVSRSPEVPVKATVLSDGSYCVLATILDWFERNNSHGATRASLSEKLARHRGVHLGKDLLTVFPEKLS